jgi:hypothetical protein
MTMVTVAYVNPPKQPGGKFGSIKDSNGAYHGYDISKFTFVKGQTYDLELKMNGQYSNVVGMNSAPQQPGPSGPTGDRWYMPFVSNTVAHALTAGLIRDPADVTKWANAAKDAAELLEGGWGGGE